MEEYTPWKIMKSQIIQGGTKVAAKKRITILTAATISIFLAATYLTDCSVAIAAEKTLIKGQVSSNVLIDALDATGIKCAITSGSKPTLLVTEVRMGRPAYNAGIQKDDVIHKVQATADGYNLTFERAGKEYQISIRSAAASDLLKGGADQTNLLTTLKARTDTQVAKLKAVEEKHPVLQGAAKIQADNKKLLVYDIEFIIDISGSMQSPDGTDGMSKFDWCKEQVTTLASRLAPFARTVTITVFNDRHQTAENCNRDAIIDIYSKVKPMGGTDLVDPLIERCNKGLENRKAGARPSLIAVITDGLPNIPGPPALVNSALIDFTKKMSTPDDVLITVLQIGSTFAGEDFCIDLDDNLVSEGAKYDIVDTRTFDELKDEGLAAALVHAIEYKGKESAHKPKAARPSSGPYQMAQPRRTYSGPSTERQDIERRLLGP